MKTKMIAVLTLLFAVLGAQSGLAWKTHTDLSSNVERVEAASAEFVERFNAQDSEALGNFYARAGALKLPGQPAVFGPDTAEATWQGGFDAGLDFLNLEIVSLEPVGFRKVLENGTYELTIQTPEGPLLQTGTYAVMWRVPPVPGWAPKILFDTIDAD